MKIEKIVWAYDGSDESEKALDYVKFLAKKYNSEIKGVYVNGAQRTSMFFYPEQAMLLQDIMEEVEKEYRSKLDSIADSLSAEGFKFEGELLRGVPNEKINEIANEEEADLIVMGKRGQGLIDRMLIGSTTLKVLRESDIPVLAVKSSDDESEVKLNNILVPIDISEKSDTALTYAINLAVDLNAKILAAYVFWLDSHIYDIPPNVLDDLLKQSEINLTGRVQEVKQRQAKKSDKIGDLDIETDVLHGISPGITIANYAVASNIDLIVMNTHGRKGIKKLVLGSETEKVIQNSKCSVLALKPR